MWHFVEIVTSQQQMCAEYSKCFLNKLIYFLLSKDTLNSKDIKISSVNWLKTNYSHIIFWN